MPTRFLSRSHANIFLPTDPWRTAETHDSAQGCWLHESARSLPHAQHKDAGYNEAPLTHGAPGPALVDPRVYVQLEALVPKAIARVYMEAPGAKTEAPKQPKKQDETEAPPGWNRSRQGPEKGPNPDGSGRGKIPGFGGRQNLVTF